MTTRDTRLQAVAEFWFGPPPGGHRWVDAPRREGEDATSRWLVRRGRDTAGWMVNELELGQKELSELFLEFAQLEMTEEAILGFANCYGQIGVDAWIPEQGDGRAGERLSAWCSEIMAMRAAVDLSRAINERELSLLRSWIKFLPDGSLVFDRSHEGGWRSAWTIRRGHSPVAVFIDQKKWSRAGRLLLHEMANKRLAGRTRAGIVYEPRKDKLGFRIVVESLLAGMWMQLANCIALNRIGRCPVCGKLLVLTPGVSRSDRKTCSGACRSKLSRDSRAKKGEGLD